MSPIVTDILFKLISKMVVLRQGSVTLTVIKDKLEVAVG
jgi:hypothetical protein